MYAFEYQRPTTLDAAKAAAKGDDVRLLAGGQSLVQSMRLRLASAATIVDLGAVPGLKGISVAGGTVTIGAMTPHAQVAGSADVRRAIPALAALAFGIGDPMVRNMGTIGGALANSDPAACYPAAVLGLGATIVTDQREIAADDFFKGLYETALRAGEIITAVRFPVPELAAYEKFKQPASRFALVGVMVSKAGTAVRVAVTGAKSHAYRLAEFEKALAGRFAPESLDALQVSPAGINGDLHGSPEYRAAMIKVMARRAVAAALGK